MAELISVQTRKTRISFRSLLSKKEHVSPKQLEMTQTAILKPKVNIWSCRNVWRKHIVKNQ